MVVVVVDVREWKDQRWRVSEWRGGGVGGECKTTGRERV